MLRTMITQHYNHLSVIIWGLMNEVMRNQRDEELHWAVDLCKDLNALAKELDPSRYTAQAQNKYIAGSAVWNMFDFASDEKGVNIPHIN